MRIWSSRCSRPLASSSSLVRRATSSSSPAWTSRSLRRCASSRPTVLLNCSREVGELVRAVVVDAVAEVALADRPGARRSARGSAGSARATAARRRRPATRSAATRDRDDQQRQPALELVGARPRSAAAPPPRRRSRRRCAPRARRRGFPRSPRGTAATASSWRPCSRMNSSRCAVRSMSRRAPACAPTRASSSRSSSRSAGGADERRSRPRSASVSRARPSSRLLRAA